MKKSNKIILGALAAIFVFTIAFQLNVNRYLRSSEPKKETDASISEERTVANFNKIFVSHSIEVYFTQDSIASVTIEAPKNNISLVRTDVKNGELLITNNEKTTNQAIIKVFVSSNQLKAVKASSGAYFETLGEVTGENLVLEFSSDTKANLELSFQSIQCKAASGSQVKFKGNTSNIEFTN